MTVLVTGGLGFIGSHVTREFLGQGHKVVATRYGGEPVAPFLSEHVGGPLSIEPLDIVSPHATIDVCRRHAVESIVHLAGPPIGAIPAIEEYRINMAGLLNVLEAARVVSARRVSLTSSIAVYMGLHGPLREDVPVTLTPSHTIEAFKKAEELLGLYLARDSGVDVVALRLASVYGPLYRTLRHWPAQLAHAAAHQLPVPLEIPDIPLFHRDDHATDLCYVDDCARGVFLVHTASNLRHQCYNIGGGVNATYGHYADAALTLFPSLSVRMEDGTGPGQWPDSTMDLTRIREDTGYEPQVTIEQALERYVTWLQSGHKY